MVTLYYYEYLFIGALLLTAILAPTIAHFFMAVKEVKDKMAAMQKRIDALEARPAAWRLGTGPDEKLMVPPTENGKPYNKVIP